MTFTAHIATSGADLDRYEAGWDALRIKVSASAFTGPTLYRSWLEELGGKRRPFVVVVEAGAEAVAVAPWVSRGPIVYSLPGRLLVAGELVVASENGVAAWSAILQAVSERPEVKLVIVPHLTPGPDGAVGAGAACEELGLSYRLWPRFVRYRLRLSETSFDEWLATWSRGGRGNLRKRRRHLERIGRLDFKRVSVPEGFSVLREMHMQQWPAGRSHSWVHSAEGSRIDLELARAVPSGVLIATLDDRPIAAILWVDSGKRRTHYYAGRDVNVRVGSPGELVFVEFVRQSFEEGIAEIDSMGYGTAKDHVRFEREQGYELVIATRKLTGGALIAARALQLRARRQRLPKAGAQQAGQHE